ncbi:MAG: hypothetical protein IJ687_06140 [Bacteroidales bacterium]|nr:hypothetical protein [Acidaminococcaceae bacterium]MBR1637410.1 hypothetical protein [Bacteroidales bacterium]
MKIDQTKKGKNYPESRRTDAEQSGNNRRPSKEKPERNQGYPRGEPGTVEQHAQKSRGKRNGGKPESKLNNFQN